jgi:hypothetical protein
VFGTNIRQVVFLDTNLVMIAESPIYAVCAIEQKEDKKLWYLHYEDDDFVPLGESFKQAVTRIP